MLYLAYGSNLLTVRLRERVPSAEPVRRGWVTGYEVGFFKRSRDGSGKCTLLAAGRDDTVHGVVFRIDPEERPKLDLAEGVGCGYDRVELDVDTEAGRVLAFTYRAMPDYVDRGLEPFDWYKALVLAGAREHGLPPAYIASLDETPARRDDDAARAGAAWALLGAWP